MNFFYQVKESVTDSRFYLRIKDNKFAKTFLYMFLLLFIAYSFITIKNFLLVNNYMHQISYALKESVPNFQLKNGEFSFEGEMPYYVSNGTSEVFVIDTTETVDESVLENSITGVLITKDRVIVKNNMQKQEYEFSEFKDSEYDKQDLIAAIPNVSWLALAFMLLWFLFVIVGHLLFAMLIVLIGLIICSASNVDLRFNHLLNFSIYALTLSVLIDLAVDISNLRLNQTIFILIYTTIAILYMKRAINRYKDSLINPNTIDDEDFL